MNRIFATLVCLAGVSAAAQTPAPPNAGAPDAPAAQPPGASPGGPPGGPPPGLPGFPPPGGKLPDVPLKRMANGKPNFNGVWGHSFFTAGDKDFYPISPVMPDVSMLKPWAKTEYVRRWTALQSGRQIPNTSMLCLPAGGTSVMMEAHALQIIQTEHEVVFLSETDHQIRVAYIDGKHPANVPSTWYGDAVAHWDGDTLVIDTVGMNDKTQLDPVGTPHSAALHMVERLTIQKDGQLDDLVTLDDVLAFERPWVYHFHYSRHAQEAMLENVGEYACAENNRDGYVPPEEPKEQGN